MIITRGSRCRIYSSEKKIKIHFSNLDMPLQYLPQVFKQKSLDKQGPVVQSVVSLTSSLRVISLTVLTDSIYNIMIIFAEKM